jgi:hypothetical protein
MIDTGVTLPISGSSARQRPVAVASAAGSETTESALFSSGGDGTYTQIRVDNLQNAVLIEERSSKTGEVLWQFPTEAQIEAFHQAARLETQARSSSSSSPVAGGTEHGTAPAAPRDSAPISVPVPVGRSGSAPSSGVHMYAVAAATAQGKGAGSTHSVVV